MEGYPISTNILEVIRIFKQGDMETAGKMLFDNNPVLLICSLACCYEKQCEGHCARGGGRRRSRRNSRGNRAGSRGIRGHDLRFKG
ncbi:gltA: glutamate synthase (NADPH), homotetrameric [Collinsella intestinalis]|nr:gltA: glutamate synthase (NADPH), homotetrameric [Collinsella intestinalis]